MQRISSTCESLLLGYSPIRLRVECLGVPESTGVSNLLLDDGGGDDEAYTFGCSFAATARLQLEGVFPGIKGYQIKIFWSVQDAYEYPLFTGWVTKAEVRAGRTDVTAGDLMVIRGGKTMTVGSGLKKDITAQTAWLAIATQLDSEFDWDDAERLAAIALPGGFSTLPGEICLSDAAGFVAGLIGGNARIDRSGILRLAGPFGDSQQGQTSFSGYSGGNTARDAEFTVTGITVSRTDVVSIREDDGTLVQEEMTTEFAAGDGSLRIDNPLGSQATTTLALQYLQGLAFRPGDYGFPQGIQVEPGDKLRVGTLEGWHNVATMRVSHQIDGGVRTTAHCPGWPEGGGVAGQLSRTVRQLQTDLANLRNGLAATAAQVAGAQAASYSLRSADYSAEPLDAAYPGDDLTPGDETYPSDSEEIISGFEIDYERGIIRGVFQSEQVTRIEAQLANLAERLAALEARL